MEDEEQEAALFRSMVDERILLLGRLKAYQDTLDKIRSLADVATARPRKNEALIQIRELAEMALAL